MGTASNAAMATKAKAMFGKRLTASDYQQLLQKKSIPEIASYLKNETLFREALEGYSETGLHRGQLEMLSGAIWEPGCPGFYGMPVPVGISFIATAS